MDITLRKRLDEACEGTFSGPDAWRLFINLKAEIKALEKDALRYRWLRNEARWPASSEAGTTAGVQLDELCDTHMR
jgi:hypothetical protein